MALKLTGYLVRAPCGLLRTNGSLSTARYLLVKYRYGQLPAPTMRAHFDVTEILKTPKRIHVLKFMDHVEKEAHSLHDPSLYTSFFEKWQKIYTKMPIHDVRLIELGLLQLKVLKTKPDLLKAYKLHLENDGKQLSSTFLATFMLEYSKTNASDKKEVVQQVYQQILEENKTTHSESYRLMAGSFAQIDDWEKSEELVDIWEKLNTGGRTLSTSAYTDLLKISLQQNNPEKFYYFVNKALKVNNCIYDEVISDYIRSCEKKDSLFFAIDLLEIMKNTKVIPTESIADKFANHFSKPENGNWSCEKTHVHGLQCSVCGTRLLKAEISDEEMESLKKEYFEKVVKGISIHHSTTPKEINGFLNFLEIFEPFDVVLDGMNLWHDGSRKTILIEKVLKIFHDKNVLIVAKKKLKKHFHNLLFYQDGMKVFYVQDMSQDDIFFTYGAFLSGKNTKIVTNDWLRDAKYKLGDEMGKIFEKWQNLNQIGYQYNLNERTVKLLRPMVHEPQIQKDEDGWHIPYLKPTWTNLAGSKYQNKTVYNVTDLHICMR